MAAPNKRRAQRPSKDKKAWSKEVSGAWIEYRQYSNFSSTNPYILTPDSQEDALLLSLVQMHGITMWSKVSEALKVRSGKQCRER
jgi:hypothetical protein